MSSHDAVFCEACGTIHEAAAIRIATLSEQLEVQREAIAELEGDLRSKRSQISRLRNQQRIHPDAHEVVAYWKDKLSPNAKELGGKRLQVTSARLFGGFAKEDLMRCIDGYALKPFVVNGRRHHEGPKDSWHADPTLIFRDAERVEAGLRIAERADDLRTVMAAPRPSEATEAASVGPLGRAALRLARFGFAVFPCKPRAKVPATRHGCLDAKRDLEVIEACWSAHPDLNVAVATGAMSGIVVLDVDDDIGEDRDGWTSLHRLEDEFGELPRTARVTTPSGGTHCYFQAPAVPIHNTVDFPGPGLDIRGDGGYVVVPPSVSADGRKYEVDEQAPVASMPTWLLERLTGYQAKLANMIKGANPTDRYVTMINEGVPQGQRNDLTTKYVGHLFNLGMDRAEVRATVGAVALRCKSPLHPKELDTIVMSISRREARV